MKFWKLFSLPILLIILTVFTICILDSFWAYEDAEKHLSSIFMASIGYTAIFIRDTLFVFTVFFYYKLAVKIILKKVFSLHSLGHKPLLKDILLAVDILMFPFIILLAMIFHVLLGQYYYSFTDIAYTIALVRDAAVVFLAFVGFTFLQEKIEPVFIVRNPPEGYHIAFLSLVTYNVWNLKETEEWKDSFFAKYVPILYCTPMLLVFIAVAMILFHSLSTLSILGSIHSEEFLTLVYILVTGFLFSLRELSFVIIGWIAIASLGGFFYCLLNSIPYKNILCRFLSSSVKFLLALFMTAAGIYIFLQKEHLLSLHDKGVEKDVSMIFHLTIDCIAIYCTLVFSCILLEFMIRKMDLENNLLILTNSPTKKTPKRPTNKNPKRPINSPANKTKKKS